MPQVRHFQTYLGLLSTTRINKGDSTIAGRIMVIVASLIGLYQIEKLYERNIIISRSIVYNQLLAR